MDRQPVSSTHLSEVGYDASTKTLEIRFNNGAVYQYFAVPPEEYRQLITAGSIGKQFTLNIKKVYQYARVT